MKKLIAIVLCLATVLCLFAGCGSKKSTYVIYSDNAFAPFEFLDEKTKEYVGFDMDLLAAIAEDQGFKYEMHNEGFDASMGAVQAGQADAMIAGMTIRDDRKEKFDFSNSYYVNGQGFFVKSDSNISSYEDLRGKTVAVKASTAGLDYAESIKDKYGFTTVVFEGSAEMYQAVETGTHAACFEDYAVGKYAVKQGVALKLVGEEINPGDYGFAVKKGTNPELIEMFNKGLENIKANGKYDELLQKYGINK